MSDLSCNNENRVVITGKSELSEWQMRMGDIVYMPFKGSEPNRFHRWMQ